VAYNGSMFALSAARPAALVIEQIPEELGRDC